MTETDRLPEVDRSGWNPFLHSLRTSELRRSAAVDGVLLSVGCSGRWYFDWIAQNWRGPIVKHIGVEAYSPCPDDLPADVEWIAESVGAGTTLGSESVDVVFAGQAIEHFWVDEMVTFLCESWRVLRPGGRLVFDSPNRRVTEGTGWWQPEHTIELNVDEAVELAELAGFDVEVVRGVWSCYDRVTHRFLPLEPDFSNEDWVERVRAAPDRPEDSFCWWIECSRSGRRPEVEALTSRIADIAHRVLPVARGRALAQAGIERYVGHRSVVTADERLGCIRFGPYVPLPPGRFEVVFEVRAEAQLDSVAPAMMVDVVAGYEAEETLATRVLTGGDIGTEWTEVRLEIDADAQRFSAQFRAFAHQPGVSVDRAVAIRRLGDGGTATMTRP